ncbi:MAG: asparagine synthase (glutamine-hydrolyzing) [Nitrospirae bacterium]|nr:asparagine synthase (glutamine-hydrolyzing) [Nitrospirota bacterium]
MCGIVGIIGKNSPDILSKMNDLQAHRGPDDEGTYLDDVNKVSMAMRRLAIIDLAYGKQPMTDTTGNYTIVFNGEIFNSPALRLKLQNKGYNFLTNNSDTEVLLTLYQDMSEQMLSELNGMFAFVIYDKRKKIVFGARDRVGIKPLYYAQKGGTFSFASELKSLLALDDVSKDIDLQSLYHYVSLQFVPSPDSIFKDIKKLPAGHFFVYSIDSKRLDIKRYWQLNVTTIEDRTESQWLEIVREKLKAAIKRWTLSDVPLACSLSGGLDSSSIVAYLSETGVSNLHTYSFGFTGQGEMELDELPLAAMVAKRFNTIHHEITIDSEKLIEDIETMVWHLDEPYGGGLPSWYVYKVISNDVKVCLTGTGGDELFGNYGKYLIYERGALYRHLKFLKESGGISPLRHIRDSLNYPTGHFYHKYFSDAVKDSVVFGSGVPQVEKTEMLIETLCKASGTKNVRNGAAYIDFQLQLPEEFLLVTDRFSMAHSLEARVPFLDHELIETVFKISPEIRTGGGDMKSFLKKMVKNVLPQEVITGRKRGFVLPLDVWMRNKLKPLLHQYLSPEYIKKQGIFSVKLYNKIVAPHIAGKANFTHQIWTLLMFQLWHKKFYNNHY